MGRYSDALIQQGQERVDPVGTRPSNKYSEALIPSDEGSQDQWVGDMPLGSVFTEVTPQKVPASFWTEIKAGIPDDVQTKIDVYSATRFPKESPKERKKRYGVHNGEVVYRDDDGKLYRETRDTWMGKLKRFAGETGAHIPSIVMGTIGAAGGPGTAALGGAGGESIRKIIASLVFKEPQTTTGNIIEIQKEALLGAGGEIAGRGVSRLIDRAGRKYGGRLAKLAGRDLSPADIRRAGAVKARGKQYGIDLTTPQTTESAELISRFNLLGDLPKTADKVRKIKRTQSEQIDDAVYKYLDDLAPEADPLQAGGELTEAAGKAIKGMKKARTKAADPFYKKAWEEAKDVDIKPVIETIQTMKETAARGSGTEAALEKIKTMLYREVWDPEKEAMKTVPETRAEVLDNVKKEIDRMLKGPEGEGIVKDMHRRIKDVKNSLIESIEEASQGYKEARAEFQRLSPPVTAAQKGLTGKIAKLEGDNVINAAKRLIESTFSSPESIKRAKRLIQKENPEAWNKAIRTYMQGTFEKIKENITGDVPNLGGWMYKKVIGNKRQRKIFQAAMEPKQFRNLANFMEILRRGGLIFGKESTTATRQESLRQLKREAGAKFGQVHRLLGADITRPGKGISEGIDEYLFGKYQTQLLDAMLSDKAAAQLQRMVKMSTKSKRFIGQFSTFMTMVAGGQFGRSIRKELREEEIPKRR